MTFNSISGIVRDEANQEVANATVALIKQSGGSIVEYTQTDSNGFYEFFFHPEADATEENWHVAVYDQDSPIFNSFSKPYVSAALNLGIGSTNASTAFGGFKAFDATGLYEANATFAGEQPFIEATGGTTVTTFTDTSGQEYQIHAFENVGTDTFEVTDAPVNATVDVLVVGGGGGGGKEHGGGGGGGGGVLFAESEAININSYTIQVGSGGQGGVDGGANPSPGGDSSALGLTAIGGGRGGTENEFTGGDGGSGGGGSGDDGTNNLGGAGTSNQGNDGGDGSTTVTNGYGNGGGGGGSSQIGQSADGNTAGDGGDGEDLSSAFGSVFGETGVFGGGGGGGAWGSEGQNRGLGGNGGGGDGARNVGEIGQSGISNTGGGGGGSQADGDGDRSGGDGGSGIVLIRYEI